MGGAFKEEGDKRTKSVGAERRTRHQSWNHDRSPPLFNLHLIFLSYASFNPALQRGALNREVA